MATDAEMTPSVPDSARDIATEYVVGWQCIHNDDERKASIEHLTKVLTNFGRAQYAVAIEKAAEVCDWQKSVHEKTGIERAASTAAFLAKEIHALLPKEGAKPGGFIPIILLVVLGAAVWMTGCVTLAEHRRAMEQAEGTGYIKGLSEASLSCDKTCWTALDTCQNHLAEAHAIAKKPKLVNGVPPCGDHDPSFFGSKGCYVDHWPSMSVPNYDGGGR